MASTVVSPVRGKVDGEGSTRRVLGIAFSIVLAAVMFLVAAPAQAAPTKVSWPVFISVKAAPHTNNNIRMFYQFIKGANAEQSSWDHFVWDTAGVTTRVTEPPSCYPWNRYFPSETRLAGKVVGCPDGSSVDGIRGAGEDFRILLGDHADRFNAENSIGSVEVHAGSGNDRAYGIDRPTRMMDFDINKECSFYNEDDLYGDRGNDRLYGRAGPDQLFGGPGNDYLSGGKTDDPLGGYCPGFSGSPDDSLRGGSGNDVLLARDGDRDLLIDCGPGKRDKAVIDRQDPKPKRCETIKRR
jgi:Ca2+-binding RTX toxin-like protein